MTFDSDVRDPKYSAFYGPAKPRKTPDGKGLKVELYRLDPNVKVVVPRELLIAAGWTPPAEG